MAARETIVIRPQGEEGPNGEVIPSGPDRVVDDCVVLPRVSTEDSERGTRVIGGYEVWAPAGTTAKATDLVQVRGEWQNVEGKVGDYGKKVRIFTQEVGVRGS